MRSFVECEKNKKNIFFASWIAYQPARKVSHIHAHTDKRTKNVVKKEDRRKKSFYVLSCSSLSLFLSRAHREGLEIYTSLKINSWVLERANGE